MAEENNKVENEAEEKAADDTTKAGEKPKKSAGKKETALLKEELDKQKDMYMRLAAEYDNYRKRTLKEREETYTDAVSDVLKMMLPIVDNLERALQFSESDKVVEGVRMTYDKFGKTLADMGVEEIECKTFDPNFHNAVMHIEDESYGEGEIVECFEKGYKKGNKVVRYAMVKVAN